MWHSRPPRDTPPFMANAILNFHFDFPHTSLIFGFHPCYIFPLPQHYHSFPLEKSGGEVFSPAGAVPVLWRGQGLSCFSGPFSFLVFVKRKCLDELLTQKENGTYVPKCNLNYQF